MTDSGNDGGTSAPSALPPPLPPRPDDQLQSQLYGGSNFANPYGGMGSYGYAPYGGSSTGMYGGIGGGYGANRFGYGGPPYYHRQEAGFARLAEESSRSAFQSAESVVQTVASVSMMLESTYGAVYSSFRAVIGVADQFSRLKTQLSSVVAAFAVFRYLHWLWRRLLVLLRLKPVNYATSMATEWGDAAAASMTAGDVLPGGVSGAAPSATSIAFWALAIGGPWLIYRLLSKIAQNVEDSKKWTTGEGPFYEAVTLFDFTSMTDGEVSFRKGDQLRIAPKELQPQMRGWLLGCTLTGQMGLVPINYVKITRKQSGQKKQLSAHPPPTRPLPTSAAGSDLSNMFESEFN